MVQFHKGQRSAFDEIYRRYSSLLLTLMYRLLNQDRELAHDLLHDIFIRLIENPNKFDPNKRFKPWIYAVATNECMKQYRKKSTSRLDEFQENTFAEDPEILMKLNDIHFNKSLKKSLSDLTFEHRCCFVLRYQEKLSIREISEVIDCPEGTVKSRIHYAIRLLSQKLSMFNPNKIETYDANRK